MKKVLVIDDDDAILTGFEFMLTDAGYDVQTSIKDGKILLEKIRSFQPDLIILDLLLSGTDGRHICKKLKSDNKTKDIPIIMISAHPDAQKTALEAGADDFLAKPFEMDDMLEKVKKYLKSESWGG